MHTRHPEPNPASFRLARRLRLIPALACAGLLLQPLVRAADAPAPESASPTAVATAAETETTGNIVGRVFNAESGTYLNNARVVVEGTNLRAFTDDSGTYRLRNVPVGEANLRVTYSGQSDLRQAVTVAATGVATADFTFNPSLAAKDGKTVVLDKFVVEATRFRNAQELATNEERFSVNIKSVVALDSLGHMTDGNIGDFVRFQPGVDVTYGSSDGNTNNPDNAMNVGVRGFGASDTAITIDGMPVASGAVSGNGSLTRAVALDALSVNNASRLEIIKVATPDMPQDSPGGSINLVTRGAFELPNVTYNLTMAVNGNFNTPDMFKRTPGPYGPSFKTLPNIRASATIPLSKTLGVTLSVASDNKYSYTYNTNMRDWFFTSRNANLGGVITPVTNANGGIRIDNPVIGRYQRVDNQWLENRLSASARVDWKPIDGLEIRVSGQASTMENVGVYRRTQWRYGTSGAYLPGILDWGDDYVTGRTRTSTYNPGYSVEFTTDARDKEGFTTQGYITLKYRKGPWSVDGKLSASESYHVLPDRKNGHFSTVDARVSPWRMNFEDIDKGVIGAIRLWNSAGEEINYGLPSAWDNILNPTFEARSSSVISRDTTKLYDLSVARELDFLPFPMTVKLGARQDEKAVRKWGDGTSYRMRYVGPTTGVPTNTDLQSDFATEAGVGYLYPMYWPDTSKIYDVYREHPEWFNDQFVDATTNTNLQAVNYQSRVGTLKGLTTTRSAWFGMVTADLFRNRLTLIAGARQERRENKGFNAYNDPRFNFVKTADGQIYRDSVYTQGVTFNGANNPYPNGDPRRAPTAVLTDTDLRARMQAAGVPFIPTRLELSPNGSTGTREKNLLMTQLARYTRNIDTSLTQPYTPQLQAVYRIRDDLTLQVAWSNETRIPEIEAADGILVNGTSFQISENENPSTDPGGDGTITLANVSGKPEELTSYNAKLSYYPQNGLGRYSVSFFYKESTKSWQSFSAYPGDPDYDGLLGAMGLSSENYQNYRINYTTAADAKSIRRGIEAEVSQNFGIIGPWARGLDAYLTYTWRPTSPRSPSPTVIGYITDLPDRATWKGGISYSAKRYSIQARWIYTESGITNGGNVTVTMPDGTNKVVAFYNPNHNPLELKIQANYVLNKNFTLFATFDRVLSARQYNRLEDSITGLQPDYASYRRMQDRGIAFGAGVNATF